MTGDGGEQAARLPRARFSVDHLPPRERFEAWHDSISCIFDVSRTPTRMSAGDAAFQASLDARMVGTMMLAHTMTAAQCWKRSAINVARDGMDHFMIQIYRTGTQVCEWRGGSVEMPSEGILVYDLAQEMRARSTDLSNVSLVIPRRLIEPLLKAPDDLHMLALDAGRPLVTLVRDHILSMGREAARLDLAQASSLVPATVQLVAACLNANEAAAGDRMWEIEPAGPGQLLAARREIERRLSDPGLGPAALCASLGLSRSRLYEIFGPLGGVTTYIRERRLAAAFALLVDPAQPALHIGAVASRFQFGASEFSRAFRNRYGMSPRAARHYGANRARGNASNEMDRRYEHWLRDLTF